MEEACGPVRLWVSALGGRESSGPTRPILGSCVLPPTSEGGLTLSRVQLTATVYMREYEPVPLRLCFSQAPQLVATWVTGHPHRHA